MGWFSRIWAVVAVSLMVSVAFQTAVVKAYEDGDGSGSRAAPDAGIPGPFRELDKLVAGLLEATVNRTDTDADGLPDTVEAVIGTDPCSADSDLDRVLDVDEVSNHTDPMEADSNGDGVPDGVEVVDGVADTDGDGTPNSWDDDNDGDGVADSRDLSPNAATPSGLTHRVDVRSSGKPVVISFQLRTNDPDNMRLVRQKWDWPYDTDGAMRDVDNSTDDVTATPVLELRGTGLVDDPELEDYGVVVVGDMAYVPLYPIDDYGDVVALQGEMFLPPSDSPRDLSVNASLKWKITGMSDTGRVAIRASNGRFLSTASSELVMASAGLVGDTEVFELLDFRDGKYTLRASNGKYVASHKGEAIRASDTEVSDNTMIHVEPVGGGRCTMGMEPTDVIGGWEYSESFLLYVPEGSYGKVVHDCTGNILTGSQFEWVWQPPAVHPISLAVYPDSFAITGLRVQEDFGTDVALVYSNDSVEEALAANMYLALQFLRNATVGAEDIDGLLDDTNVDAGVIYANFSRLDEAVRALAETLTAAAKAGFPAESLLPVVTALETRQTSLDLSSLGQGRVDDAGGSSFDISSQPLVVTRLIKTTWYNGSGDEVVAVENAVYEMRDWEMESEALAKLMTLVVIWNQGEQQVISVGSERFTPMGDELIRFEGAVLNITSTLKTGASAMITVIYYATGAVCTVYSFVTQFREIVSSVCDAIIFAEGTVKSLWNGLTTFVGSVSCLWDNFAETMKGFLGVLNFVKGLSNLLCIVGLAIGFLNAFVVMYSIGASYRWSALGTYTAILYGIMMSVWAIILFGLALASLIPKVGIIFTLISLALSLSDTIVGWICGRGWTRMLMDLIADAFTDVTVLTQATISKDETEVVFKDLDGDGIDAGDRIVYRETMEAVLKTTRLSEQEAVTAYMRPAATFEVPVGSGALTGHDQTTGNVWYPTEGWVGVATVREAWVEPTRAMINLPVTIVPRTEYDLIYEEWFWLFGWWSEKKHSVGNVTSDPLTIYVDVMPPTVGEFARWREIASSDDDGDGVNDLDEPGARAWSWDYDGDGLGDAFEREIGSDPAATDSDHDGLDDRREAMAGSDPTVKDTDLDGLTDAFELTGWVVNFTYCGHEFFWHVLSDPLLNDTDSDGVGDHMEYLTMQNPRSRDTNGDGARDGLRDYWRTEFGRLPDLPGGAAGEIVYDIAVGRDGSLYELLGPVGSYGNHVRRLNPYGFDVMDFGGAALNRAMGIACDAKGNIYVAEASVGVIKYDRNGTQLAFCRHYAFADGVTSMDVAVDDGGDIYLYIDWHGQAFSDRTIMVFDGNGNRKGQFGTHGSEPGNFSASCDLAFDPQGLLYVADPGNGRVQVFGPDHGYVEGHDGIGLRQNPYGYPCAIAVGEDGSIYIGERDADRVQKLDPNWTWIATIDNSSLPKGTPFSPSKVAVMGNGTVLVVDLDHQALLRYRQNVSLVRVEQQAFAETDGDGLSDAMETAPWSIDVTTESAGTVEVNVTSDPGAPDTDRDGLNDSEERALGTDPRSGDTDCDGLTDPEEVEEGTDPCRFDSDADGLRDGAEVDLHCDPNAADTDGEGLGDLQEVLRGSDPRSTDTDQDGLPDQSEAGAGSDPTRADSDGDAMLDGREADVGALLDTADTDGDGLRDGLEDVVGTDATEGDSDGDLLADGLELAMRTDPLAGDTDGDGVLDGAEVERGLDPRSGDSDSDGVPDADDGASELVLDGTVHLVVDLGADKVGFAEALSKGAAVEVTTAGDLMASHSLARYIVVVGNPASTDAGTAFALIRTLLADAPDVLARMEAPSEGDHIAVRYGRFAPEQTIVMLSRALQSDPYRVLGIFKGVQVRVSGGVLTFGYIEPRTEFELDDIDAVRAAGAAVRAHLDGPTTFTVDVQALTELTVPTRLTTETGLDRLETSIGRYVGLHVNGTVPNASGDIVAGATVWVYYTLDDLDVSSDGYALGATDVGEATLGLYWLNGTTGLWTRLTTALDWVTGVGLDTADFELYGRSYAGKLWANVTHLSTFGLAGRLNFVAAPTARAGPDVTVRTGRVVAFNGTASTGMGNIANYEWTFQYDGRTVTLQGPAPSFTFERAGMYRVTLNVTDMYGGTAEDSFSVKVEKEPARVVPAWAYIMVLDLVLLVIIGLLWVRRRRRDALS